MAVLEIRKWPNECLSLVAEKVIEEPCAALAESMIKTMDANSAVGLAGPQIGVTKRIITLSRSIYKDAGYGYGSEPEVMINPEILDGFGEITLTESCLSIPGSSFWTQRANIICVRYEDINRELHEETFSGFPAIVIQHECDHLDGITLADKADIESRRKIMAGGKVSAV